MTSDPHPARANVRETFIRHTCGPNEDCEGKADQEQNEDQDEMPFRQGVEPHGGQSVTRRHLLRVYTHILITKTTTRELEKQTNSSNVCFELNAVTLQPAFHVRICQHC